ncbi:MAG TPA: tRNA (adenosine(37)-N6)-threonylcarbamoyltransferase complex transferase subunit TsaD [Candidatus Saccharimonadales bacterium]
MNVLGIETSCDENAAAVVKDGRQLLSNVVLSQVDLHKLYGGVVPEVAARSHIEVMTPTIDQAIDQSGLSWDEIDAVCVANGPGLGGSLLIGTLAARTLALIKNKPLYGVHHALGHVYANFIDWDHSAKAKLDLSTATAWAEPEFELLALIVSGGHSHLVLLSDHQSYRLLGQTQDDAVGEAFDKVAKLLGLAYPGGPSIEAAAKAGHPDFLKLPKASMPGFDYSFSGLKTAVLRAVQALVGVDYNFPSTELANKLNKTQISDIAASFQRIAIETLVDTAESAYSQFRPKTVVIAGGVAANSELRRQLAKRLPLDIRYAPISLCTDNAAMIAALGFYRARAKAAPDSPFKLDINPSLVL